MDEYQAEFPCPQCGGTMIPIQTENYEDQETNNEESTVAVPKSQITDISGQEPKRPVKVAQAIDLGFAGMLSKSATGPYKRPTGPLPPISEMYPHHHEESQYQYPEPEPTPAPQPSGKTTSGKKKFVMTRPGQTQNFKTAPPQQAVQQPPQTQTKTAQATTTQKKIVFQTSARQGAAQQKQPQPTRQQVQNVTPPSPVAVPPRPATQTATAVKGRMISASTRQPGHATIIPTRQAEPAPEPPIPPAVSATQERAAIDAERIRMEADEATRKEHILKEAQLIAEAQIRLAKEEAEKKLAEERALMAKKAADDAEMARKIAEEAARKAAQETSALFSEKIIAERQKIQIEAEDRIKKELEKLEQMRKELEEAKRKAEEAAKAKETSPPPEEKKKIETPAPELPKATEALKEEKPKDSPAASVPNTVPEIKTEAKNEMKPEDKSEKKEILEEKEKDKKSEGSTASPQKTDEKSSGKPEETKKDDSKDEKKTDSDKKEDSKEKSDTNEKDSKDPEKKEDKTAKSPLKKPLFPDKKNKKPLPFQTKKATASATTTGAAKIAKTNDANDKTKDSDDKSEPGKDPEKTTQGNKNTLTATNITNSGLMKLKKKKAGVIYAMIGVGSLLACVVIILFGILIKKIFISIMRSGKSTTTEKQVIRKTTSQPAQRPVQVESKYRLEYNETYQKVKKMPAGNKKEIEAIIAEWNTFINKFPDAQNDTSIVEAKKQRDTMEQLKEMF